MSSSRVAWLARFAANTRLCKLTDTTFHCKKNNKQTKSFKTLRLLRAHSFLPKYKSFLQWLYILQRTPTFIICIHYICVLILRCRLLYNFYSICTTIAHETYMYILSLFFHFPPLRCSFKWYRKLLNVYNLFFFSVYRVVYKSKRISL